MGGDIFKKIRVEKGLKQETIAEYLSISQNAYSKIENNHTKITLEKFLKFSEAVGMNPEEIIVLVNKDGN
jgi:transcriptional regulator with XRE-family HTH domain